MKRKFIKFNHFLYRYVLRRFVFLFNSEQIHDFATGLGGFLGKSIVARNLIRILFSIEDKSLAQKINGIYFKNPMGLAAGFDYKASLTQILPALGFGFQTIGTITNKPYAGNPKPRLGRLIKSRSLMVYKGFKNDGIDKVTQKLENQKFIIPVGLSIGKTNSQKDKMTQNEAVLDILSAFRISEEANLKISYYELNISCPNLYGIVTFYTPGNLNELLSKVTKLKLTKPVFIKMPISKSDKEVISMLSIIIKFPIKGIIFGNTQNNRKDTSFVESELEKYPVGNFSGKPTEKRSNELIRLAYKKYNTKLMIIGCGGVFSAQDAYKKIRLGASLVQFITGLIFEGPQLAAEINSDLIKLLKKDGFKNINEAIGIDA